MITSTTQQSPMQAHAVRLGPDTDLVPALLQVAAQAQHETSCAACFVLTAVGSLSQVTLRMASASRKDKQDSNKDDNNDESNEIKTWNERVEIVSMVGTFSSDGSKHLHMVRFRRGVLSWSIILSCFLISSIVIVWHQYICLIVLRCITSIVGFTGRRFRCWRPRHGWKSVYYLGTGSRHSPWCYLYTRTGR